MKKILVVEDEYYARKSIVKILQESDLTFRFVEKQKME